MNDDPTSPFAGGPPASTRYLGFKLTSSDAEAGQVTGVYDGRPEFCNPAGVIQGGFLTAMLDDIMSFSGVLQGGFEKLVPTLELKASFLAPVWPGDIRAEGRVIRAGKRIAYLEGALYNHRGEPAVTATATARLILWQRT